MVSVEVIAWADVRRIETKAIFASGVQTSGRFIDPSGRLPDSMLTAIAGTPVIDQAPHRCFEAVTFSEDQDDMIGRLRMDPMPIPLGPDPAGELERMVEAARLSIEPTEAR